MMRRANVWKLVMMFLCVFGTFVLAEAKPAYSDDSNGFPELAFVQMPRGKANGFPWPAEKQFRNTWSTRSKVEVIRVAIGTAMQQESTHSDLLLAIRRKGDGYRVEVLSEPNRAKPGSARAIFDSDTTWKISDGSLEHPEGPIHFSSVEGPSFVLKASHISAGGAPNEELFVDWSYAATLLAQDKLIDEEFVIPMGRCSMDTRPAQIAREHARMCLQQKRLGCFLQFQIRIMGDQFDRAAYSTYGEAAHPTEANHLLDAGLDVARFFRGLVLRYDSNEPRRGELNPQRLARAVREIENGPKIREDLINLLASSKIDDFSRLRTLWILTHLEASAEMSADRASIAERLLKTVGTFPPGQKWLEHFRAD